MEVDSWSWQSVDGSVRKRILQNGILGERPTEGTKCTILLSQSDGVVCTKDLVIDEFDTKWEKSLERCLRTMAINEEALFDWGGGHCTIKLKKMIRSKQSFELNEEEKLKRALNHKERGKILFNEGRTEDAYSRFQRSVRLLVFIGKDTEEIRQMYNAVCNNIALCHLRSLRFEDTVTVCNKVLESEPENVKCLLRRAAAYKNLRDFEKCHADFVKVIALEPNNPTAKSELPYIVKEIADMNLRYNGMVKKMFTFS